MRLKDEFELEGSPSQVAKALVSMWWVAQEGLGPPAIDYAAVLQPSATTPRSFEPPGIQCAEYSRALRGIFEAAFDRASDRDCYVWGYRRLEANTIAGTVEIMEREHGEEMTEAAVKYATHNLDCLVCEEFQKRGFDL